MRSNQPVTGTRQGRPLRGRLLGVAAAAVAVAATATPAAAGSAASPASGPGVRVVGTTAVGTSHVGVIVSVPGAGGPLDAQAFRLWENGRPKAVRVDPLPGSALRVSVVVDARPGDQLQGAQNAVSDLMIGLPDGAEAAVAGARPARLIQPLTSDAGSVVRALAGASFSGAPDDASALALAVREVRTGPAGRRAVILITTSPVPAALVSALPGQLRAAGASLYVAAVPDVAPSLAKLARDSGGWAVTASSARSLLPAVDAIGADLAHQCRLAYTTTYPALTATRLRVAVAGAGTTATAEATVRVPGSSGQSAAGAQASAGRSGQAGLSVAWLIAAVLLIGLAGVAVFDMRRERRQPRRT
ncbi:MAG TPA: hypothetical protein VFW50_23875 [Streptosporangiaceae bacterium]|nr:hypothetical protein [Streptosporangiaceae bacterium]